MTLQQPAAKAFSNEIIDACLQARESRPNDEDIRIDLKGLPRVKVSLVLSRYHNLTTLHEYYLSPTTSGKSTTEPAPSQDWEIPRYADIKPVEGWTCLWGIHQDSKLLVGIWKHGFGDWAAIQRNHRLGLTLKTLRNPQVRSWNEHENKILLCQRAEYLLDHLQKVRQDGSGTSYSGGTF